jgi:iron complex outermembrane recepter protein
MRTGLVAAVTCFALAGASLAADTWAAIRKHTDIPGQQLGDALRAFARDRGLQLIYLSDAVESLSTPGAVGELTPDEALTQLLSGTGLAYRHVDEKTVSIFPAQRPASSAEEKAPRRVRDVRSNAGQDDARRRSLWSRLRLAQAGAPPATEAEGRGDGRSREAGESISTAASRETAVEEVIVTGSHIRGADPVVPVQVFTRQDFARAGATTTQEFLALLPQNFGGTQSADTTESSIPGLTFDLGYGSSVNLRGVGASSTLVLIDGRRMAAAGTAAYSDVSMIPLAAVERIEVMTDGAAALYGSDAIGGVVNFILRKDFSGAETRLQYGDTTEGGLAQRQASQLFGMQWSSGNAVLAAEYVDQDDLDRLDRDFSANMPGTNNGPRPLIPAQESSNIALFARQRLGDRVQVSANGMYSQREGASFSWDPTNLVISDTDVRRKQYGAGLGVTIDLGRSWHALVSANADKSTMRRTNLSPIERFDYDSVADLQSATAQLTGDLWLLPWGAVKVAVGVDYRSETLDRHDYLNGAVRTAMGNSLDSKAAFGELLIPVGSRGDRSRAPLELSLAGRYEEHGDVSNTFDPKYGVRWSPLQALSLYASYGTSFKVPSLDQLSQSRNVNSVTNVADVATGGSIRALTQLGNNEDLSEETAKILSAGIDLSFPVIDGLQGRVNYFDIEYADRISSVTATAPNILALPAYRSLVIRRGDVSNAEFDALLADLLSGTNARVLGCSVPVNPATGACGMPVSSIRAVIDRRLQNFSAVQVQGVDLSLTQRIGLGASNLTLSVDASYMLSFDQQLNPASAEQGIVSTLYNPVDLRLRTIASWDHVDWTMALSANYTDGYTTRNSVFRGNNSPMPVVGIDAWTTFDLTLGYRLGSKVSGVLENTEVGLSVTNLLDEDPPFVDDQYIGLGYDPANADPRGRFISLGLTKSW